MRSNFKKGIVFYLRNLSEDIHIYLTQRKNKIKIPNKAINVLCRLLEEEDVLLSELINEYSELENEVRHFRRDYLNCKKMDSILKYLGNLEERGIVVAFQMMNGVGNDSFLCGN